MKNTIILLTMGISIMLLGSVSIILSSCAGEEITPPPASTSSTSDSQSSSTTEEACNPDNAYLPDLSLEWSNIPTSLDLTSCTMPLTGAKIKNLGSANATIPASKTLSLLMLFSTDTFSNAITFFGFLELFQTDFAPNNYIEACGEFDLSGYVVMYDPYEYMDQTVNLYPTIDPVISGMQQTVGDYDPSNNHVEQQDFEISGSGDTLYHINISSAESDDLDLAMLLFRESISTISSDANASITNLAEYYQYLGSSTMNKHFLSPSQSKVRLLRSSTANQAISEHSPFMKHYLPGGGTTYVLRVQKSFIPLTEDPVQGYYGIMISTDDDAPVASFSTLAEDPGNVSLGNVGDLLEININEQFNVNLATEEDVHWFRFTIP